MPRRPLIAIAAAVATAAALAAWPEEKPMSIRISLPTSGMSR